MEANNETIEVKRASAWQPLTPRGVAAFAGAPLQRALVAQFLTALLAAAAAVWFLASAWFPTIRGAIAALPASGEIRSGQLVWTDPSPRLLADGHFLAFSVDLQHEGQIRSPAHVQIEFGRREFKVLSLLGYVQQKYPAGYIVAFNQEDLGPWWGAWAPMLLALAALATAVGLLAAWSVLASLYAAPVWLLGFFLNRDIGLRGAWRMAGAALLPGALFMIGALVLYGMGVLDLIRLIVAGAIHFVIPWGYLLAGCWRLPRLTEVAQAPSNPFSQSEPQAPGETASATPAAPAVPPAGGGTDHDDGTSTRTE